MDGSPEYSLNMMTQYIGDFQVEIHRGENEELTKVKVKKANNYMKYLRRSKELSPEDIEEINREVENGTIPIHLGIVVNGTGLSKEHLDILFECSRRGWLEELKTS